MIPVHMRLIELAADFTQTCQMCVEGTKGKKKLSIRNHGNLRKVQRISVGLSLTQLLGGVLEETAERTLGRRC